MDSRTKTVVIVGVGLGLWWLAKQMTAKATAAITAAQPRTLDGLNFDPSAIGDPSTRIGAVEATDGLGRVDPRFVKRPVRQMSRVRIVPGRSGVGRPTTIPMPIQPYAADAQARTAPWWDRAALLNQTRPIDPYPLQPVDSRGDAVNIRALSPVSTSMPDRVVNDGNPELVNEPAESVPYVEPGDPSFGNDTTTDWGEGDDDQTYNPDPGALIGVQ